MVPIPTRSNIWMGWFATVVVRLLGMPSRTMSSAVIGNDQSMAALWGIKPMGLLELIDPLLGLSRPSSRCNSVDFPAPFGPTSAVSVPACS